jgi:hypothetical protein
VANKFEFKTQEGTYLHGIAETFQGLNYANTIEYKDGKKIRAFVLLIILEMVLVLQIL